MGSSGNSDGVSGSAGVKGEHPDALCPGALLSEFVLDRVLGMGGFSFVYLAFDQTLQRHVAIKEYLPSAYAMRCKDDTVAPRSEEHRVTFASGLRSFIEEARLLAKFEHPALVKVLRFWEANGTAYMAMQYYQGRTLRQIVRADPGFPTEARLKTLIAPLLDAVALLHAENCYHRDIAPDNIIVQPNGAPVLLDFGAARRVIGDMTHALTVVLKPGYAPIEQYAEESGPAQGPWTDVYAFAAVLYAAISGKPPMAAVARAYSDALVPLSRNPPVGYSLQFLQAIDAALAVRPEERPQSIAQFRTSLGLGAGQDTEETQLMPRQRPAPTALPASPPQHGPHEHRETRGLREQAVHGEQPALPATILDTAPASGVHWRWGWVSAGIAAAVLVAAAALYFTLLDDGRDSKPPAVAETAAPPPIPAPVVVPPDPREQVRAAMLKLECGHASFDLDAAGSLTVNGHVQNARQQSELELRLRGIEGVKKVETKLSFVPRPFCEVTSFLEGIRTSDRGALEARVTKPKPPLRIGQQPVFIDVAAPGFAANITVDVWSLSEKGPERLEVAHLLPHAGYSLSDLFKANETKTINRISDGTKPQVIRVYPPAGRLLFTAIASDRPLVARDRALLEDPLQYLTSLRAEIESRGANARIATWYGFVEVLP
jgi:serine/threonine protein kinase